MKKNEKPKSFWRFLWCGDLFYSMLLLLGMVFLSNLEVMGQGKVKSLTLNYNKITLLDALRDLNKKSGNQVMFKKEEVEQEKVPVALNLKDVTLMDAVRACLANTNLTCTDRGGIVVVGPKPKQQISKSVTLRGVVKDETGHPLPGATVKIKGTTIGTASDIEGHFLLPISGGMQTLEVSFVGYENAIITADGQKEIEIHLKPATAEMEEVVVTGIFNKPKSHFTGAANTFTKEQLQQVSSQNLLTTLSVIDPSFKLMENITNGSNPNSLPDFEIRGAANMSGLEDEYKDNPNEPTFILDGFEVSKEKIFDLDPERIESVTILKDAAATAIYGSRAANGVVVLETKALAVGELKISYNFTLDMDAADISVYNLLNAREKLQYEEHAKLYEHPNIETYEKLQKKYNDRLEMVQKGYNTDWLSQPLNEVGVGHRHSLLLEGGDKAFRYGLTLNYKNKTGAMIGSKRNNLGIGVKLQYNYKDFKFLNNLSYETVRSKESPYGNFRSYAEMNPYFNPWDETGKVVEVIYEPDKILNPLYNATLHTKDERKYDHFINNFSIEWRIMDELKFTAKASLSRQTEINDDFKPGQHTDFYEQEVKGRYTKSTSERFEYEINSTLSYTKMLNKHLFLANLGFNAKENKQDMYSTTVAGFPNDKMDHIGMGSQYLEESKPVGAESISRLMGFIGNASYSYDNRFLVDASLRLDGSSQFGADKRWGHFWSAGLGWNIHNEAFLKESQVISLLKLRASMGYTGSQKFNPYQALMMYKYLDFGYGDNIGTQIMAFGNQNLKWQRTDKRNIGLDFELLEKKISGSFNYYQEYSKDVLTDITLAPSLGFDSYKENLGEVKNAGYEISLRLTLLKKAKNDLLWNISGSLVHNDNKLMKINDALTAYNNKANDQFSEDGGKEDETEEDKQKRQTTPLVKYQEGQSMNSIWCVRSLGIDPATGQEVFLDRNGMKTNVYNPADQIAFAVKDPKIEGNVGTNFSCYGFQLNAYFMYKMGGYIYNQTLVDKVENVNPTKNVDSRVLYDRWVRKGDISKFKSISDRSRTKPTSRFVEKENVLECKSINLSYTFNREFLKWSGFERLKLTLYANDLFRFSTVKQERGISYPFARNYTFGLQATF